MQPYSLERRRDARERAKDSYVSNDELFYPYRISLLWKLVMMISILRYERKFELNFELATPARIATYVGSSETGVLRSTEVLVFGFKTSTK